MEVSMNEDNGSAPTMLEARPLEKAVSELSTLATKMFAAIDVQSKIIENQFQYIRKAEKNALSAENIRLSQEMAVLAANAEKERRPADLNPKMATSISDSKPMPKRMPSTGSGAIPQGSNK